MIGKLTKISNNENALRTSSVEGWFYKLPTVGESFRLYSTPLDKPIDSDYTRMVTTSLVKEISYTALNYEFKTLNSTYLLEVSDIES